MDLRLKYFWNFVRSRFREVDYCVGFVWGKDSEWEDGF